MLHHKEEANTPYHIVSSLFTGFSPYLRVNLEVSLLNKLVVARVRA